MLEHTKKAYLLLSDGTLFEGYSFGATGTTIGEVVFTTGMTGYGETLTDPSYYGQIVTQTFPLIGNYGVNQMDHESDRIYLKGYIVREWCDQPSNFRCEGDINTFLQQQGVIGIYGIDTRSLTRKIREFGVMNGMVTTEPITDKEAALKQIREFEITDAVKSVSGKQIVDFVDNISDKMTAVLPSTKPNTNNNFHIVLFDFGYKYNIARCLARRNCKVTVVPYNTTAEQVKELNPDGIMLSNGPGNPAENVEVIETIRELVKMQIPIFGICLGHQLMALANGARTEKLKYGHRGSNQPVIDLNIDQTLVTSQNHGYAVVGDSIPEGVGRVSHVNANDGTCEGVEYFNAPAFTVQFHPEARGGPLDTDYLFDRFMKLIEDHKRNQ
ncbi:MULTISPECIES: glutamine-hydrolyzing carbamoyl-phosphate synthase small subunit [Clostridiaceae]|uniref:Carbamoyl phosphate synthase small chain n=1 Tax=Clostridium facile TaxID=2763035 RepID=A0ABR7IU22_9CLOT|nr:MULTISPECIES: glutamine-hydrolyzing carbamoyl-phosphate synthase small subunit [Clostridiaceae]MBC5788534.1 glutamine-hydrolyzing carbamoyl-phosphate synthase small subunit [Clostridium facile]